IKVPHWERGTKEVAWLRTKSGDLVPLQILALGGSIPTEGLMKAQVIEFKSLDALKKSSEKDVKGKIVFLNQAMKASEITTFSAYGGCYGIRGDGAVEAAKFGAIGVIIRSLAMPQDEFPHTGSMHYSDEINKIPAAALSTNSANLLSECIQNCGEIEVLMELNCVDYPDAPSFNVIAEITGSEFPNQIITIGGHLDSWDAGEGAHDDGAGIVHCLEALRLFKVLKIKPKHTIRLVFFMNEENGNRGGMAYAEECKSKGEQHIAAIESDRGGFTPHGFDCDGPAKYVQMIKGFSDILKPYGLHHFEKGYGGVDIGPLKKQYEGIPLFGFVPDSQRYFDFHHAASDVFENVNKRELELGCATMASFIYLLDKSL
ncbi:MAG: M20/M25/M40 family metallo-hydrolase, partial [Fluviicola sp.]